MEHSIRRTISCLGSVDRRVNLNTDVEVLASEEVLSIGRNNATQLRARSETLESLRRDGSSEADSNSCRSQSEGDHDWLSFQTVKSSRVKHLDEKTQTENSSWLFINTGLTFCSKLSGRVSCKAPRELHQTDCADLSNARPLGVPRRAEGQPHRQSHGTQASGKARQSLACSNACECPAVVWTAKSMTYRFWEVVNNLKAKRCLESREAKTRELVLRVLALDVGRMSTTCSQLRKPLGNEAVGTMAMLICTPGIA